jgi:hypothetical protein
MTVYEIVKYLLTTFPETRDSDKKLLLHYYKGKKVIVDGVFNEALFMTAVPEESITRARRKIQEKYPYLSASPEIEQQRMFKAEQRGTFIYRETV